MLDLTPSLQYNVIAALSPQDAPAFVHWPGKTYKASSVYHRLLKAQHGAATLRCEGSLRLTDANGTAIGGAAAAACCTVSPYHSQELLKSCSNADETWGVRSAAGAGAWGGVGDSGERLCSSRLRA
eukprot:4624155-Prymnesium_polylepis.1